MKKISLMVAGLFLASMVLMMTSCDPSSSSKNLTMENDVDSISYALGVDIGKNIQQSGMDEINSAIMGKAFDDVFADAELEITPEDAKTYIQKYFTDLRDKKMAENLEKAEAFLKENATKEGVIVTESGLQYEVIVEGDGPKPLEDDMVSVSYKGTLIDGTEFDATKEGEPAKFKLNGVIKGWTEGLALMPVGSKYKFYIHPDLGYGQRQMGEFITPNSALIFEVELIEILDK